MTIITGEFWEIAVFQYFSLKILLRRVTSVSWACEREKTLGGVCHTPEACDLVCLAFVLAFSIQFSVLRL